ncbi:serpin family protein [Mucilaginibacter sp.]|uniref:serpin family protein n=1 Tax=Mucilaginibacter sp. TaxID=1882438 RepID=UPI0035BC7361
MIRKNISLTLACLAAGLIACNKNNPVPAGKDLVLTASEQQQVAADNAFTLKLFKQVSAGSTNADNLFISPLSVSFALGMTANGAKGETLQAINSIMEFKGNQDQINSYYKKLITDLPLLDGNSKVSIANSIWYKQGFDIQQPFITTNTANYNAKVQSLDFASSGSKDVINNWVKDATGGKVPSIIDRISSDDYMYLINAIYFKSTWKEKFDAAKTAKQNFITADGAMVNADFMTGKVNLHVFYDDKLTTYQYPSKPTTIVELPYNNDKYSMVLILPRPGLTTNQLLDQLDAAQWQSWMTGLQPSEQTIYLPKFKFSYQRMLNSDLMNLGMGIAFSNKADFTGINALNGLKITAVKQKAFVEVDENGTEATAATSVTIGLTSAAPMELRFDRPFIFAIREMKSGLILFTGIMNNPTLPGN